MKDSKSRRDFLKTTVAGATAAAIASTASSYGNILGSNDKIRVGIVGFSDRCKDSLIPAFMKYANELKFEIVAVSDIWKLRREEGAEHLSKITGKKVDMSRNNDELYDRKDVDAVIAATADFQHAQHCIEAVKAGRDCYVEKPFANTMEDAREALKIVSASNKIVQIGTQRRSTKAYMNAFDFIKQGKFGDIIMVEMSWNVNQPGRWRRPKLVPLCKEEDVDWKRFLINRPYEPFDPRKYVEFRLFWPYSSGIPCQWMVHQIDTVHWFTGLKNPTSVVVNGGLYSWRDGRKNFDTLTAVFDYGDAAKGGKGFQVLYHSRMTNSAGSIKEIYFSNGGTLNLDTNKISPEGGLTERYAAPMDMKPFLLPAQSLAEAVQVETAANTGADDSTSAHMRNWMECVRSRKTSNADIHAGYEHSVALCMVIAAMQTGKKVTFNTAKQEVVSS